LTAQRMLVAPCCHEFALEYGTVQACWPSWTDVKMYTVRVCWWLFPFAFLISCGLVAGKSISNLLYTRTPEIMCPTSLGPSGMWYQLAWWWHSLWHSQRCCTVNMGRTEVHLYMQRLPERVRQCLQMPAWADSYHSSPLDCSYQFLLTNGARSTVFLVLKMARPSCSITCFYTSCLSEVHTKLNQAWTCVCDSTQAMQHTRGSCIACALFKWDCAW